MQSTTKKISNYFINWCCIESIRWWTDAGAAFGVVSQVVVIDWAELSLELVVDVGIPPVVCFYEDWLADVRLKRVSSTLRFAFLAEFVTAKQTNLSELRLLLAVVTCIETALELMKITGKFIHLLDCYVFVLGWNCILTILQFFICVQFIQYFLNQEKSLLAYYVFEASQMRQIIQFQ